MERHWASHCTGNSYCRNAIRKIEHARAVGKKIRACTIIPRRVVEWIYRPEGLTAQELVLHYACLQNIRTEMRKEQAQWGNPKGSWLFEPTFTSTPIGLDTNSSK
ncbi:20066_t:CDS:2, partial [Gigaspora margarita]